MTFTMSASEKTRLQRYQGRVIAALRQRLQTCPIETAKTVQDELFAAQHDLAQLEAIPITRKRG